jgi:hypothetical protein
VRVGSDHDWHMPGRASLPLFGVESTDLGDVLLDWFAVCPAGAKVAPRLQPQGGGGYGSSY